MAIRWLVPYKLHWTANCWSHIEWINKWLIYVYGILVDAIKAHTKMLIDGVGSIGSVRMCLRTDTDTVAHKYLCIFEVDSGDRCVLPLFCITQACGLAECLCVSVSSWRICWLMNFIQIWYTRGELDLFVVCFCSSASASVWLFLNFL